ncbi:MAG: HlyD family efflux transporter periplasmic adaptor subunit [Acidobacteria bacterium]|nr:HlyD family efflux transporter periplasmic adaptor subunit [Acidobacteriota bacterium]
MKLSWFNNRMLWLIVAVTMLVSGSAWWSVNRAKSGAANLETAQRSDLTLEAPIIGALGAARSVDITAPISSDPHFFKIARMAPEGSRVEAGQMVMELDTQEINQKLRDGLVLLIKDETGKTTAVGETRWPNYALMSIPDTSAMKARVQVLEADAGNLRVGQAARLTVDSNPGVKFDAVVERIDTLARQPDKDSPVKYFEAVLKVEGRGGEILKPGKLVRAEITTASYDEAIVIPRVAVVEEAWKHLVARTRFLTTAKAMCAARSKD